MTLFRDRMKPGFAFLAENETSAENGSLLLARNGHENGTATPFSAEDENENKTNIQDMDEVSVTWSTKPDNSITTTKCLTIKVHFKIHYFVITAKFINYS